MNQTSAQRNNRPDAALLEAVRRVRHPILVGHITPDADCLGSILGLAVTLREHDIDAVTGLPADCVAKKLLFMLDLAANTPRATEWAPDGDHDAIIILDTAGEKRINISPRPDLARSVLSINIDHHITNTDFAAHNWVDPHATSTCEMIARLHEALGWQPSEAVASLLYAGIHGDTAGFSLPSTSADSLDTAATLVRAGADVTHIGEQLCRSLGTPDFELLRRVYDHTTVTAGGRIAYSYLTYEDITESKCSADDIDDQVSIPRALRGVRIAMLFSEGEPGVVRINLRGEGKVTVIEIAQKFQGGGHSQSAGVRIRGKPMQDVIRDVVAAAEAHLATQDA